MKEFLMISERARYGKAAPGKPVAVPESKVEACQSAGFKFCDQSGAEKRSPVEVERKVQVAVPAGKK